jgi:hypothetical protein
LRVTQTAAAERRRYGRIRLDEPMRARFGGSTVYLIELSVIGFRIAHEARYAPNEPHELTIDWQGTPIRLICAIARTSLWRLAKSLGERSVYHSGLKIVERPGDADRHLRELVAERIIRAIDEQKANARGVPPLAAYMYQPAKGDLYRRCELIDGVWRKTETIRAAQPPNGFTVSVEVDPRQVDILCATWEHTTLEGRRLTQLLAELSISKGEGIPTRRYEP